MVTHIMKHPVCEDKSYLISADVHITPVFSLSGIPSLRYIYVAVQYIYIYIYIYKIKVDVTCFVFNKFKLCKIICQRVSLSSSGLLHSNVVT